MPEQPRIAEQPPILSNHAPRFTTVEQFIAEYNKCSQLPIDLDPRIDLTQPIYDQAAALSRADHAAEQYDAQTGNHSEPQ